MRVSSYSESIERIRKGNPQEMADALGTLFRALIPVLPASARSVEIDLMRWSQPFPTNTRWREIWRSLGVATVGDLAEVGSRLAETRGVGRSKILILTQDLIELSRRPSPSVTSSDDRSIEAIRSSLVAVANGPPKPHAHLARALLRAVVSALPAEIRAWDIHALPWTSEWCYTTEVWSELGVKQVADLVDAAPELSRTRGIGRGKIATLAEELIFMSPELWARMQPRTSRRSSARTGRAARSTPHANSLVAAIDRLAERLSPQEKLVLRRRIGWRHSGPVDKLRTLAEEQEVTQERIRQVEALVLKRLARLIRIRKFPAVLREAIRSRPEPVSLASLSSASGPIEFSGMLEVWRPLAELLNEEGGPYLVQDLKMGDRVFVSPTPELRRLPRPSLPADTLQRGAS